MKRSSGAPLAIHPDDAYRLNGQNIYGFEIEPSVAEQELREGDRLAIGQLSVPWSCIPPAIRRDRSACTKQIAACS